MWSPTLIVSGSLVMGSMAAQIQCGEREKCSMALTSLTSSALTALRKAKFVQLDLADVDMVQEVT